MLTQCRPLVILFIVAICSLIGAPSAYTQTIEPTPVRVSVKTGGAEANTTDPDVEAGTLFPAVSFLGRYVAFSSRKTDLVALDANGIRPDIFRHDRETVTTILVSTDSSGTQGSNGSQNPSISGDGMIVAFETSSALDPADTNGLTDIYVKDLTTGAATLASVDANGNRSDTPCVEASLSADGRYVAFRTSHGFSVTDSNGTPDIYVKDLSTGSLTLASVSMTGAAGGGTFEPAINDDGTFVAFESDASDLVPQDGNGVRDVFLRNLQTGTTVRVSLSITGTELPSPGVSEMSRSEHPISSDGTRVGFVTRSTLHGVTDNNGSGHDVFVFDTTTGVSTCISLNHAGTGTGSGGESLHPSLSSGGDLVAFESRATDLITGDGNGFTDIFLRDLQASQPYTQLISLSQSGAQGNNVSFFPSISSNGTRIAFDSDADNLVPNDNNLERDTFLARRTVQLGQ